MTSIFDSSVIIQTSAESVPSTPSWFGEIVRLVWTSSSDQAAPLFSEWRCMIAGS